MGSVWSVVREFQAAPTACSKLTLALLAGPLSRKSKSTPGTEGATEAAGAMEIVSCSLSPKGFPVELCPGEIEPL